MNALVSTALWVVGKALAPVADGVLEAWGATKNFSQNIKALKTELGYVKATLEIASHKHISGEATEKILWKLRDSARRAEDLLDELDYFRIHGQLRGTYDAADQHAKGCIHELALNARHTARAILGLSSAATHDEPGQVLEDATQPVGCCAWPHAKRRSGATSSSTPNINLTDQEEVRRCMPKLGKLLACSSSPNVHDDNQSTEPVEETTLSDFNKVDFSKRMKHIVEELQPVRIEFTTILHNCAPIIVPDIAQSRPITTGQSIEPKLYGRDRIVNSIIHDMTKGKYHSKDLTVLPIVGPGGIGKTTLIQHIYRNQQVQNHFQVVIWVCVSLKFNLNKLLEDIKKDIPPVEGEKGYRTEELIEQRLKSKRFLLVLDDIWKFSDTDDWERLLLPLRTSQEKGSMILLTTRFPEIAKMIEATNHIELEGLESEQFRKLFIAFVFGNEPFKNDYSFLLETGDRIIEKLKGSPLAAKTVGRLLRKDLNLGHWIRVLDSKEWARQTGANDIMPALKLSYDYLPFHQQQCFSCSALFPEDHWYSSTELINLWIGLDILQPDDRNQTMEDIGLSNLKDLVAHGFFKKEETTVHPCYVMHDLLHDLALKVASHDSVSLHRSNVGSLEIQPSICHLSIIIDRDDIVSPENFGSQLRNLKRRLKVKQLHTLMLFGEMNESFANILGDLFREADGLRVLHLHNMSSFLKPLLHNFSRLLHLRYLCLGRNYEMKMHIPLAICRFYHLRIMDLGLWYGSFVMPKDLSNLAKLRCFYTQHDELHSDILNVGKLIILEELKVFRVNKESAGFEPKQLEHLTKLRELGIYNLENIHTGEEAAEVKLIEKRFLKRLTLDWDSKRSNIERDVEAAVLKSLQPHRYLEELCIRGHGGHSCPTWLDDELAVEALQSLHLDGVSWQGLPPFGKMGDLGKVILKHITTVKKFVIEKSFCRLIRLELIGLGSFEKWVPLEDGRMFPVLQALIIKDCPRLSELPFSNPNQDWNIDWFPKLQDLEIENCPEFLLLARIPWTGTLRHVNISDVKLLEKFKYNTYSKSSDLDISGKDDLQNLDQVLAFNNMRGLESLALSKCPPLELKHLLMLTSLKTLAVDSTHGLVGPLGGEWQLPVEHLVAKKIRGSRGKELTELLSHLPRLSKLHIEMYENITQLAVGVDVQQTTSATRVSEEKEEKECGLLVFQANLSDSLRELVIWDCPELVLLDGPTTFRPVRGGRGGWLQALRSLQILRIHGSPNFLSYLGTFSFCLFPSSLQELSLIRVEGMGTLEPLSNLTSLTQLHLSSCGVDLRCKGLGPLLTAGGQLRKLDVFGSPRFFAGWDPNAQQDEGGKEQELQQPVSSPSTSKLQELSTDDVVGLLAAPVCSVLSSSLAELQLFGFTQEMEGFTKEQEDAIHLLASLQELKFYCFRKLQHLPAGLHKLTNLKKLGVLSCPVVRSLPNDGLPVSLQELDVWHCGNEELTQQCRGLLGTIPEIRL